MDETTRKKKLKNHLLMVDESLCIGCLGCEAACRVEHNLPESVKPFRVFTVGPLACRDSMILYFNAATCFHCDDPACVNACPTGAMQKRDDGIVFSDKELCIGCRTCAAACPFGIPELNPANGKIVKCNGCMERKDAGLWPSCVVKCPTGALTYGDPTDVVRRKRVAEAVSVARTFITEKS